jgi:hypothetical protein
MAEGLSVLFRIGRLPTMITPASEKIGEALALFLDRVAAKELAGDLGIPPETRVHYEVKFLDDIVESEETVPVHLSIRGEKNIAKPLHDKLRSLFTGDQLIQHRDYLAELAASLGIHTRVCTNVAPFPVQLNIYVRSESGEKFD